MKKNKQTNNKWKLPDYPCILCNSVKYKIFKSLFTQKIYFKIVSFINQGRSHSLSRDFICSPSIFSLQSWNLSISQGHRHIWAVILEDGYDFYCSTSARGTGFIFPLECLKWLAKNCLSTPDLFWWWFS